MPPVGVKRKGLGEKVHPQRMYFSPVAVLLGAMDHGREDPHTPAEAVGRVLLGARQLAGWTSQGAVSRHFGWGVHQYARFETGSKAIDVNALDQVARLFDTTLPATWTLGPYGYDVGYVVAHPRAERWRDRWMRRR